MTMTKMEQLALRLKTKYLSAKERVDLLMTLVNQATAEANAYKYAWLLVESSVVQEANEKKS